MRAMSHLAAKISLNAHRAFDQADLVATTEGGGVLRATRRKLLAWKTKPAM